VHELSKDRRGVSELMVTAFMLFIMFLVAGMMMQLIGVATAQLAVNAAAFSAARAAAKSETPYDTAVAVAEEYGKRFLAGWEERSEIIFSAPDGISPGSKITVEITYTVPQFFTVFPPPQVRGVSSQVMEELP